jgi:hypothetical protein
MEPQIHQRKYESLSRAYIRLNEYYLGKIDKQDSFNGPKDFVYSYFHATYSLKEALKNLEGMGGRNGLVETYVINEPDVALGIDISNLEKHVELKDSKSGKNIGKLISHIHIFDPQGKDRTELTIEIDGIKIDCLDLAKNNLKAWKNFMASNNIVFK